MSLTLGSAVIELAVNSARFNSELQKAHRDFNNFASGIQSSAKGLAQVIGGIGFTLLVRQALDAGDAIAAMADRTGLGVEALQELQYAARQSNADVGTLENGIRQFQIAMTDAARGSSQEAVETFRRLGVSATTSSGALRTVDEALVDVAEAISRVESPSEQADLAVKAFGRSGTALLPMLKEGRSGLAALGEEAHRVGSVLSAETVAATKEASDEIARMATVLKADLVRAVAFAVPAIREIAVTVRDVAAAVRNFFSAFKDDSQLGVRELEERVKDVKARLEGLKAPGLVPRGGAFMAPPRGAGNPELIRAQEAELARLERLLEAARKREQAARRPAPASAPTGISTKSTDALLREAQRDFFASIDAEQEAYEAELRALADLRDAEMNRDLARIAESQKGLFAALDAETEAYEDSLRAIARFQDEQARHEKELREQSQRDQFSALDAEIAQYEDGLRAMARIRDEEAQRVRDKFHEFFAPIGDAVSTSVKGVILGIQSVDDALKNLGQNIGLSYLEKGIKAALDAIENALLDFLQDKAVQDFIRLAVQFGLGLVGVGVGAGAAPTRGTTGGVSLSDSVRSSGSVSRYADGGIVPATPGGRLVRVAEGGRAEAIVPLEFGPPRPQGPLVEVNIKTEPGASVEHRQRSGFGGKQIHEFIVRSVNQAIADGQADQVLRTAFGLRRRGVAR